MKILVTHPTGNQNVRFTLSALLKNGFLTAFHTSIAVFPKGIIKHLIKIQFLSEFKKREFFEGLEIHTQEHPFLEILRLVAKKMKFKFLIKHEVGLFSVDKVYQWNDKKTAKAIKVANIDAVYAYEDGALLSFRIAKVQGIKCFYDLPTLYWKTIRTILEDEKKRRPDWASTLTGLMDSEEKLTRKDQELVLADAIYVATNFTKKTLTDNFSKLAPIHVIPYGFPEVGDKKIYKPLIGRKIEVLFVGKLTQAKGIAEVIEAATELKDIVELTIVGGKSTELCEPLNEALKKFKWIPSLPHKDILNLMREKDVLVFPSLLEGFGLVITEAMSQGTPVITTNRTAGIDLIYHEKNGWLMDVGSTKSLLQILLQIHKFPYLLESVGMAAMLTASKRPWNVYEQEFISSLKLV